MQCVRPSTRASTERMGELVLQVRGYEKDVNVRHPDARERGATPIVTKLTRRTLSVGRRCAKNSEVHISQAQSWFCRRRCGECRCGKTRALRRQEGAEVEWVFLLSPIRGAFCCSARAGVRCASTGNCTFLVSTRDDRWLFFRMRCVNCCSVRAVDGRLVQAPSCGASSFDWNLAWFSSPCFQTVSRGNREVCTERCSRFWYSAWRSASFWFFLRRVFEKKKKKLHGDVAVQRSGISHCET